jgi:hypothetical protein
MADKKATVEDFAEVVGLPQEEAAKAFAEAGWSMRVTRRDGQGCICTRDYRLDRVNVGVAAGVVTEVRSIG